MADLRIPRRKPLTARVGVISMGHYTYWPQFAGLLDEMKRKTAVLVKKLEKSGVTVMNIFRFQRLSICWRRCKVLALITPMWN